MYNNIESAMSNGNTLVFFVLVVSLSVAVVVGDDTRTQPLSASPTRTKLSTCGTQNFMLAARDDYVHTPCIGSHKLHVLAQPWNTARKICEEEGGHLAIINSVAEANVLKQIFETVGSAAVMNSPHPDFAAIGFHDLYEENDFVTIHGNSLFKTGYSIWAGGQPDNAGDNEDCGSIHISGGLNDINCNTRFAFFCELHHSVLRNPS